MSSKYPKRRNSPGRKSKRVVVLLSGGLDSATALYWAVKKGYRCHCLIFDYGQRHRREINSARKVAASLSSDYQVIKFTLPWKGSSLVDEKIKITLSTGTQEHKNTSVIPQTYVPGRNTIFLSFAVSFAETIGAQAIVIGANQIDFSGYPDCRTEYYHSFQDVIKTGTRVKKIRILTPLIDKTKSEIIKLGKRLGVPYGLTWSCYRGGKKPCGRCDSCLFREKGFREAGVKDPLLVNS